MDIRAMRYFLAIAETENVSKAAEKLHMSQPPLTRQMKQLEEELNVELFERESGRLHLTEAGYYFRERAREIVELTDKLEEEMKSTFGTYDGNISIGSIETVGVSVLPTWITEFHSQFPEITYNICYSNTEEIVRKLDLGIFDVGIVREPFNSEKYECIRLREESQLLREYCTQIQSLFQSEIDIRQNRIMQILTIVTTIFLPLTLLVGWYGMNFSGMPELHWKYGYPAIILVSVAVVVLSLWVCKKKKFW